MTTGFSIQVPSIGTEYYFFDDDKININKRYIATITDIIPFSQAPENLIYEWSENLNYNPNIFNEMTDVFIQTSIPEYDDDPIYFVRDIHGSFYSIEVTNDW